MAIKGQQTVVLVKVVDSAGAGKTGQSATLTLYPIADGVKGSAITTATEIDSTNLPGIYAVTVPSGSCSGVMMGLGGLCSTSGCVVLPAQWTNAVNLSHWKDGAAPNNTGDAYARLGSPSGASIAADLLTLLSGVDVTKWKGANAPALTGDPYAEAAAIHAHADTLITGVNLTSVNGTAVSGATEIDANVTKINGAAVTLQDELASQASVDVIDGIVDALLLLSQRVDALIENSGGHDRFKAQVLETVAVDLTAVSDVTDKLDTMIENTGGHERFKAAALETVAVDLSPVQATTDILAGMIEDGEGAYKRYKATALEEAGGGEVGPGSVPYTYGPLYYTGTTIPIDGVEVAIYTDAECETDPIDRKWTNAQGTFLTALDPGIYYLTRSRSQVSFTNPIMITVEA